uniref:CD99 molecule (Xg blood group) n=1 Tax=Rousettus aegyptiacus TaxID=9407 RepID=A0A7J8B7K5_ROUAE|nr:CD99 molecule (Xg blood group) [Rousettus aegyptiacus]
MARRAPVALLLLLLALLSARAPAQDDFDLSDAIGDHDRKPTAPPPRRPNADDDFDLQDALGGGGLRGFSDADLAHGTSDGGEAPGVVPGIVGAVVVAVAGAISSFIAYQKKKFCFKENADQGEMNMENHHTTNAEPPVQQTLLEK